MSTTTAEGEAAAAPRDTRGIQELVNEWRRAKTRVDNAQHEVRSAQTALENAKIDLAKRLLPRDAAIGERIGTWVHDESRPRRETFVYVRQHQAGGFDVAESINP